MVTDVPIATMARSAPRHGVGFGEAVRVWMRVAMLSFGGPAGQIAVMHRILVEEKRWLDETRFLHALNYCMLLPGPEAQQLATYIGWLMHRTWGGIVAGTLFVLPGIVSIMALSYVYAGWGNVPFVAALFFGLKAAVLAIVLEAVFRIGRRSLKNGVMIALAVLAFIGIFFLGVPFPMVVFGAALIGFLGGRAGMPAFQVGGGHGGGGANTAAALDSLLGDELPEHARPTVARALRAAALWLALWLVPVFALLLALGIDNTFSQIAIFFSKMAMVTFGGAYAVLAYVAQQAVEHYGWLMPRRDARRARDGGDDSGAAHHGAPVRRLHGRFPRPRRPASDSRRDARRPAGDLGDLHALLPLDIPRRAVHRNPARQQGRDRRARRDHSGGGGRHNEPRDLVRDT
jgi:chromate transporter